MFWPAPNREAGVCQLMKTLRHWGSATIFFRWTHVTWSGPGDERLEQAANASMSSSAEKGAHSQASRSGSSSRTDRSQGRSAAELYVLWSASHNSGIV